MNRKVNEEFSILLWLKPVELIKPRNSKAGEARNYIKSIKLHTIRNIRNHQQFHQHPHKKNTHVIDYDSSVV